MLGDAATYVPVGDAEALAAAIRELTSDEAKRDAMRERAYSDPGRS